MKREKASCKMKSANGSAAGQNKGTTGEGTNRRFRTPEPMLASFGVVELCGEKQLSSAQSQESNANRFESVAAPGRDK
jgi:hypothetical protein